VKGHEAALLQEVEVPDHLHDAEDYSFREPRVESEVITQEDIAREWQTEFD
jgi:hypothetical protein